MTGGREMETRQKLKIMKSLRGGERGGEGGEKHERLLRTEDPSSQPPLRAILDSAASLRRVLIDGTPAVFTESQRD